MKRNIQKLFSMADDAMIPVDRGGDPQFARDCLQQIINSEEASEEDKSNAKSMMHRVIDTIAEMEYC